MKKFVALFSIMILSWCIFVPGTVFGKAEPKKRVTLTKENPIHVDMKGKSVTFLAEVNGKYLVQPTRHGVVFAGGKFGDKCVFKGHASPKDFYEALTRIGLKPGNNMTMDNKEKTFVQGDLLDVTVSWDGAGKAAYKLDEVIIDSNKKPLQIRFGGNLENALKVNTGCLLCLDSCPVGITSNASYTYGAVEKRNEVTFKGNQKILPSDGTLVVITIKKKK
ncbi:MAG: YdjY domain-containing protein [Deltaproteobacteria bacterium]|nr:YdjY domain-containing protein [Deltaproteobacteria bacterium]